MSPSTAPAAPEAERPVNSAGQPLPRLLGGHLALDFVNTLDPRDADPVEFLLRYTDLVTWLGYSTATSQDHLARLARLADKKGGAATRIHRRALVLREALHRCVSAAVAGEQPRVEDASIVRSEYTAAVASSRLVLDATRMRWEHEGDVELATALRPLAFAGVDLLTGTDLHRIGKCGLEGCGWFYLDVSKNHSRRWCSMDSCGNVAKARRFYARQQERS